MTTKRGRPLNFATVEELTQKIEDYFKDCLPHPEESTSYEYHKKTETRKRTNRKGETVNEEFEVTDYSRKPYEVTAWRISEKRRPSITGLALFLNTSRQTLLEYEGEVEGREKSPEFADTIKRAKDIIEFHWEELLEGNNVTGVIFSLKNNFNWEDKSQKELTNPDGSLNPYSKLTEEQLRKLAEK